MLNKFEGTLVNNGARSRVDKVRVFGTKDLGSSSVSALPNVSFDAMEMQEGAWAALSRFS